MTWLLSYPTTHTISEGTCGTEKVNLTLISSSLNITGDDRVKHISRRNAGCYEKHKDRHIIITAMST
jgi:hypothetical protein